MSAHKKGGLKSGRPTRVSVSDLGQHDIDVYSVEEALAALRARYPRERIVFAGKWSKPHHYTQYGVSGVWQRRDWRRSSTPTRFPMSGPFVGRLAGKRRYDGAIIVYFEEE